MTSIFTKYKAAFVGLFIFILGAIANHLIPKLSDKYLGRYLDDELIYMDACAPLISSIMEAKITEKESGSIVKYASSDIRFANDTAIYVRNDSGIPLRNAVITIIPITKYNYEDIILSNYVDSSSIEGSKTYTVKINKRNSITIEIPLFHDGEDVLIRNMVSRPIDYQIELFSEEIADQKTFSKGCTRNKLLEDSKNRKTVFRHTGKECKPYGKSAQCDLYFFSRKSRMAEMKADDNQKLHIRFLIDNEENSKLFEIYSLNEGKNPHLPN